jgi:hypothetical protein
MPALRADRAGQRSSSTEYMLPAIDTKRVEADIATVKTCKSTFVCFDRQRCLACAIRMAPVACPGSWNWEDHVDSISLCTSVLDNAVCSRRQLSFVIGPSGGDPVDQPRRGEIESFTGRPFAFASHPLPSTRLSTSSCPSSRLQISQVWCSSASRQEDLGQHGDAN